MTGEEGRGYDASFDDWASGHMSELTPQADPQARGPGKAGTGPVGRPVVPVAAPLPVPPPSTEPAPRSEGGWWRGVMLLLTLLHLAGLGVVLWLLLDPRAGTLLGVRPASAAAVTNPPAAAATDEFRQVREELHKLRADLGQPKPGAGGESKEEFQRLRDALVQTRTELSQAIQAPGREVRAALNQLRTDVQDVRRELGRAPGRPAAAGNRLIYQVLGTITTADPKDRVRTGSYAKVFLLPFEKGKSYQIDLMSVNDLDPYLRIDDGTKELAYNDDGGGYPNSRLVFRPSETKIYRIVATTFASNVTGSFLMVREQ